MHNKIKLAAAAFLLMTAACNNTQEQAASKTDEPVRIVSMSGTTTEILCALGLEDKIVGVDVTSTYPVSVQKLPKVGHNRNMSAEAILAVNPTLIVGISDNIKPELLEQLGTGHAKVMLFDLESSVEGSKRLIRTVADSMGMTEKSESICNTIDADLKATIPLTKKPKVLFIYARGTGTVMAAGKHTYPNSMIALAGGENVITDFEDFKPLTPEFLVSANPDVILMFDSGLESLGGVDGLLQIQGIKATNAGKNKKVIEMESQLLTGFGPRVGKAIAELSKKLNEVTAN